MRRGHSDNLAEITRTHETDRVKRDGETQRQLLEYNRTIAINIQLEEDIVCLREEMTETRSNALEALNR
jgi:hypothetical protein